MSIARKPTIQHFSHEHPLVFNDEADLDSEDTIPKFCSICGLIFFINSYYSCSHIEQGCDFTFHQRCAILPQMLLVTFEEHDTFTFFNFQLIGPNDPSVANEKCLKCGQICKNFTYSTFPKGKIHPSCILPLGELTQHRIHNHPLITVQGEVYRLCNICCEEGGTFLSCQVCNIWISQDCAVLPPVALHLSHSHPLVLYYNSFEIGWQLLYNSRCCDICRGHLGFNSFYSCGTCQYNVHLRCIKSSIKNITREELGKLVVHLPAAKGDTLFPRLIANLERDDEVAGTSTCTAMSTMEGLHQHKLILHGTSVLDDEAAYEQEEGPIWRSKAVCDACINPINSSTPYYSCSVSQCHFLIHKFCAKIPYRINGKVLDSSTLFLFTKQEGFFSVFRCRICQYDCNGFGYSTKPPKSSPMGTCIDIECASTPKIIKHESHKKHYLHLSMTEWYESKKMNCCSASYNDSLKIFRYKCTGCPNFQIHVPCALLPREVGHKFDKHLLQLTTDGGKLSGLSMESDRQFLEDCGFCEVCEEVIDPRYWFYYCPECDQYLHVNCIPSVGKLSKLKFGGTLDDHVGCHEHPLTCVRMLNIGTQSCACCKDAVQGFDDDWAFLCESCDVWIHNECARRVWDSTQNQTSD